jgi:hypothetical protein
MLRHKFIDNMVIRYDGDIIDDPMERLINDDYCIYCNLIVDDEIDLMFDEDVTIGPEYKLTYDKII